MARGIHVGTINLILCIAVSILGGCAASPPGSAGEELVRHRWILGEGKERQCRLTFSDHTLTLTAQGFGEEVSLSGDCFVQEQRITVLSEEYGTVCFDYSLRGDKLLLSFFGKNMTLVKQREEESIVQN